MMTKGDNGDTWCKHRTAFSTEIKVCKIGVDFHQFIGAADLMPCLGQTSEAKSRCPQYCGKTAQELAAREAMLTARFDRITKIRAAIELAAVKAKDGVIDCPCCGGRVMYGKSRYNGHIHAACSTADCASWIE